MKLQHLACALALATSGLFFSHAIDQAIAAPSAALSPSQEQGVVTRQLATMMDREHYLNMPLDEKVSARVLEMYFDSLDPEHSLFLQSDIEEFRGKYSVGLGEALKQGDLAPAFEIYTRYQQRMNAFQTYVMSQLDQPQNLKRTDTIEADREKAPYFNTEQEQQVYWQKQLVSQLISLTIAKQEETAKQKAIKDNPNLANGQDLSVSDLGPVETLKKRYRRQIEQFARFKNDQVLKSILNAALATYDPHSNYYTPIEAMELNRQTTLALEGIGVSIRPERGNDDYTRIESIMAGGPASKSGKIRTGDRIIGVAQDGEPMVDVVGWSSGEIVGLIRGKRGTKVTIKVVAAGESLSQARQVLLVRDVIQEEDAGIRHRITTVKRDGKTYKIGVLEVPSFYFDHRAYRAGQDYRSVSKETEKSLLAMNAAGIDGLVVDLRNNPGGSLDDVARMLGLFIKDGVFVQIRDGNGNINAYADADNGKQIYAGPMTVLINLASASASEIFAAAIQDYERGVIMGSTTTGKGTAQEQLDKHLVYGQATITKRKFYRVTGGSTQNKGVIPDIAMVNIYDEDFGERKAKNAFVWDTVSTAPYVRDRKLSPLLPTLNQRSQARQQQDPQFIYLKESLSISMMNKGRKEIPLNIDQRRQDAQKMEELTLAAENRRRQATGLTLYANWETYQAAQDAAAEQRSKLKRAERPALPEDEAYVNEAAQTVVDLITLAKTPVS